MTTTKSAVLPDGRTVSTDRPRPFYLRTYGASTAEGGRDRWFGSLAAARNAQNHGVGHRWSIFFEYATGCGHYLEGN